MSTATVAQHGAAEEARTGAIPVWLLVIVVLSLAAGGWLRFSSLETKYYYRDEVYTSLHAAGYTLAQLRASHPSSVVTAAQLVSQYQAPKGSALDTVRALAISDSQHPPLYYLLARGWERVFGSSIEARRAISALFGVLLLPAMFWLARTLFGSTRAALVAAALVAVSPYHFVYAQEAREWSLFEVLAVVTATLLLRAMRSPSVLNFILYGVALTLTMYSAITGLIALAAFILYAALVRKSSRRGAFSGIAVTSAAAFVAFIPWLWQLVVHWRDASAQNAYAGASLPLKLYAAKIIFAFATVFFDAEYGNLRLLPIALIALAIAAYAVIVVVRTASFAQRAFIASLIAINLLLFVISDLVLHGSRAAQERYLILTMIGVDLAVAFLAVSRERLRLAAVTFLLLVGLISIGTAHTRESWWNNNDAAPLARAATYVSDDSSAIVLTPDAFVALQFADVAKPNTRIAFDVPAALKTGSVIYAVDPDARTIALLRKATHSSGTSLNITGAGDSLGAIHAQVAAAHGSRMRGPELWKFSR